MHDLHACAPALHLRLLVIGTGWGGARLLRDINPKLYDLSVLSARNHMVRARRLVCPAARHGWWCSPARDSVALLHPAQLRGRAAHGSSSKPTRSPSPRAQVFTPLLASTCVGTLEPQCVAVSEAGAPAAVVHTRCGGSGLPLHVLGSAAAATNHKLQFTPPDRCTSLTSSPASSCHKTEVGTPHACACDCIGKARRPWHSILRIITRCHCCAAAAAEVFIVEALSVDPKAKVVEARSDGVRFGVRLARWGWHECVRALWCTLGLPQIPHRCPTTSSSLQRAARAQLLASRASSSTPTSCVTCTRRRPSAIGSSTTLHSRASQVSSNGKQSAW